MDLTYSTSMDLKSAEHAPMGVAIRRPLNSKYFRGRGDFFFIETKMKNDVSYINESQTGADYIGPR
jgi:hypothetical protein